MKHSAILEEATSFVAAEWPNLELKHSIAPNIHLRDRITLIAPEARKLVLASFPELHAADDQVMLLVIADGVARSGIVERVDVESALGIILPKA